MTASLWPTVRDSEAFRRFVKEGAGRRVVRSRAYRRARLERHRVLARRATRENPTHFDAVRSFCVFVGHTKSGASLLSGLLDAHPRIVMADERDALRYVQTGFARDPLFHVLERGARVEARKGRVSARRLESYDFWVPGGWHGRSTAPLVVGDSTTGKTTRRLAGDARLLTRTTAMLGDVDLRLVHVVRNPFDPLSVMRVRGGRSVAGALAHYMDGCDQVQAIRARVAPGSLLEVRHEDVVADPRGQLDRLCRFLDVTPYEAYLAAAASIITPRPAPRHTLVAWDPAAIREVEHALAGVDFLEGYTHDA